MVCEGFDDILERQKNTILERLIKYEENEKFVCS